MKCELIADKYKKLTGKDIKEDLEMNDGKEGYRWKTMKIVFTGNWINIR